MLNARIKRVSCGALRTGLAEEAREPTTDRLGVGLHTKMKAEPGKRAKEAAANALILRVAHAPPAGNVPAHRGLSASFNVRII